MISGYQAVVEDQVSPSFNLFISGVFVRLECEEWGEGVLPRPVHAALGIINTITERFLLDLTSSVYSTLSLNIKSFINKLHNKNC